MPRLLCLLLILTFFLSSCSVGIDPLKTTTPWVNLNFPKQLLVFQVPLCQRRPQLLRQARPSPSLSTHEPYSVDIRAMQAGSYTNSDIVIEEEFSPGGNYRRYYTSYLSERLKVYALLTIPFGEMPVGSWPAIVFNHG